VAPVVHPPLVVLELLTQEAVEVADLTQEAQQVAQAALASSLSKLTNKTYDRKNLSFVRHQHSNAPFTSWC
jgi:hypothetical protein